MKEKLDKLNELLKDEELAKELLSKEKAEDAQKWMSAHGIDMTLDEVRTLGNGLKELLTTKSPEELEKMANEEERELSDDELESAAGGSILGTIAATAWGITKLAGVLGGSVVAVGAVHVAVAEGLGWLEEATSGWSW